ncbi:MAG: hypothetical protein ACREPT_03495 [Rudaea sp.]
MNEFDVKQVWRNQHAPAMVLAPAELRAHFDRFERRIARRNLIEYLAGAFVIAANGFDLWLFPDWPTRAACLLIIAGVLILMHQLRSRTSVRADTNDRLGLPAVVYFRSELVRQRNALRSVGLWYVLPLLPGTELFFWARRAAMSATTGAWVYWLFPAVALAVILLNLHGARRVQREIDRIDANNEGETP